MLKLRNANCGVRNFRKGCANRGAKTKAMTESSSNDQLPSTKETPNRKRQAGCVAQNRCIQRRTSNLAGNWRLLDRLCSALLGIARLLAEKIFWKVSREGREEGGRRNKIKLHGPIATSLQGYNVK